MEFAPDTPAALEYLQRLTGAEPTAFGPAVGATLKRDGVVVGAVVFHDYCVMARGATMELSGGVDEGVTVQRKWIRDLFAYPFKVARVTRLQAFTRADNVRARKFLERLLFDLEGHHVRAYDGEADAVIYAMVPEYCIWIEDDDGER